VDYLGRPRWVVALFPPRAPTTPGERGVFDAAVRSRLGSEVAMFSAGHTVDHESRLLRRDLAVMASIVVAAVAVLTLLSVGGIRDGALALIPVTVATGVMLAFQACFAGPLNLMSMTALPLVIGIGVDDGIYYLCRHREPDRPNADRTLADNRTRHLGEHRDDGGCLRIPDVLDQSGGGRTRNVRDPRADRRADRHGMRATGAG